jgi:transcriptional regulator with XRE-family HTH domain
MTNATDATHEFTPGTSRQTRTARTLRDGLIAQAVRSDPSLEERVLAQVDAERKREIGARIKELRELSGYTQPHLAEQLGYTSVRGYQKAEATGGMEHERYEKLAELFGVDLDYLLRGTDVTDRGATVDEQALQLLQEIAAGQAALTARLDALLRHLEPQLELESEDDPEVAARAAEAAAPARDEPPAQSARTRGAKARSA